MSNKLTIAISGKSGCGNTTVSRLVAEKLGLKFINYTFHNMAEEKAMDFFELCEKAEHDSRYDLFLDQRLKDLAAPGQCVLGSRLAIWLLDKADIKIYLEGSVDLRVKRIAKREEKSYEQALDETKKRDKRDRERYMKLYNIDVDQYQFVDMLIDTGKFDQYQIADMIILEAKKKL
ncbi:MAG: cytidylate kinase family protein [Spirochaetales bacterium]|nr:cytidylate kinase family protein [Spirochaetales bacterium]